MRIYLCQIVLSGSIALTSLSGLTTTYAGWQPAAVDQWFDTYGDISWDDERAHLDNFSIALQEDPNLVGYIIVYAGRCACVNEARDRALRAKKYTVETRGIPESRIKWIDGGYREEFIVFLQPAPTGAPAPTTSSTVKPGEVKFTKNCNTKTSRRKRSGAARGYSASCPEKSKSPVR